MAPKFLRLAWRSEKLGRSGSKKICPSLSIKTCETVGGVRGVILLSSSLLSFEAAACVAEKLTLLRSGFSVVVVVSSFTTACSGDDIMAADSLSFGESKKNYETIELDEKVTEYEGRTSRK